MSTVSVEQFRRMEKLELIIHDLCEKGARDAEYYLSILQAINDGQHPNVNEWKIFLSLAEQYQGFLGYSGWLKINHVENVIPDEHFAILQRDLIPKAGSDALIFYCHKGDVILTAQLAWEYIRLYRKKCRIDVKFNHDHLELVDGESARPNGFYIMKRPPEDKLAIGKKFQGKVPLDEIENVRRVIGDDSWGMSCEGIQFVGITHPHYPEIMDGEAFPFIDLAGFKSGASYWEKGSFAFTPHLTYTKFHGLWLEHGSRPVDGKQRYGLGTIQKC